MAVVEKDPGVLTEKLVLTRTRAQDLDSVKKLNCWGSGITDVSVIRKMANLEVCSLSGNKIRSLEDFSHCPNLQELYIRKNKIEKLQDVHWLKKLNRLRVLWLADNSCSTGDNYRMTVLKTLPNLQKLDNVVVTEDELNRALDEGEELPFPEKFIANEELSGKCLLEQVEMCDELEVTREPCEESIPHILKLDVPETTDHNEQHLQHNEEPILIQNEKDFGTESSCNDLEISGLTLNSEKIPEIAEKESESILIIPSIDKHQTSSSISQNSQETENSEVKESSRNPEIKESASPANQVVPSERCSAPILIFEKGHNKESSKDSMETNPDEPREVPDKPREVPGKPREVPDKPREVPDRPREVPDNLKQSETASTIIKTKDIHQNNSKLPPVALSFEQSNKLREELGLKPLPIENISTVKSIQTGVTKAKNANILQATLLLVKDLDKDSLEIVKDVIQTRLDLL